MPSSANYVPYAKERLNGHPIVVCVRSSGILQVCYDVTELDPLPADRLERAASRILAEFTRIKIQTVLPSIEIHIDRVSELPGNGIVDVSLSRHVASILVREDLVTQPLVDVLADLATSAMRFYQRSPSTSNPKGESDVIPQ